MPFIYEGVEYNSCTDVGHNQSWCSTTATWSGSWGNCNCGTTSAPTAAPTPGPAPGPPGHGGFDLSQPQKDAILQKHNELRAGMGASDMTEMSWDDTIARAAQQWAGGGSLLL